MQKKKKYQPNFCRLWDSNPRVRTHYDLNVTPWTARANRLFMTSRRERTGRCKNLQAYIKFFLTQNNLFPPFLLLLLTNMGRKFAVRHTQTLVRPVLSPESECKRQKVTHSLLPEKDTNVSSFKSVPQRNSSNDYYYCVHLLPQIIPQIDWKGLGVKL